jgi:acyl-CoA thioester hydrolase
MAYEFRTRRRVEFAETDCAGIIHFTSYLRYMEEAEHAYLRSLGLSVKSRVEGGELGFPRLSVRCEFLKPARFEEVLDLHLWVSRKGRSSLTYAVVFSKDGAEIARGETTAAACLVRPDGKIEPVSLPEPFSRSIEEAPYPPLTFKGSAPGGAQ